MTDRALGENVRIVTWNMQAAFGSNAVRHERAWHYLCALDPDIALLQEVNPPDWAKRKWKVYHGPAYEHQTWGSAVLVKDVLHSWVMDVPEEHRMPRCAGSSVVLVEIQDAMERVIVGSIYASAWKLTEGQLIDLRNRGVDLDRLRFGGVRDIWPLYTIFDELERVLPGQRFVAGGDFNAARLMDQSSWMAGGNAEFFGHIESRGFQNGLRKFHDAEVQTYFKKNKQPYQLDHLYCDSDMLNRLSSCRVIDHPVTALDLSDHAPIVAEFSQ